jgi:chemotaxis protein MotB
MRLAVIGVVFFALSACGMSSEQYDALDNQLKACKGKTAAPKEDANKYDVLVDDAKACNGTLASTKDSLAKTEKDRDGLKAQLAGVKQDKDALAKMMGATKKELAELRKAREAAEARMKIYKQLMARLQSMIDSGKISVKTRKGKMVVQMSDKILFDPGKTKLKDEGKAAIKQLAAVLKDVADRDFLVAGHTDNVPIKTKAFKSNWELSAARGVEVVKFLQAEGVDPKHLAAAGYSEHDPVGDNNDEEGKKSNRRIEIVLMPNIEELPKLD